MTNSMCVFVVLLAVATAFPAEDVTLMHLGGLNMFGASENDLVQIGSSMLNVDYPGCSLGYFWCLKLKEGNVTSSQASKITFEPTPDNNFAEWTYNGMPLCVAHGDHFRSCELHSLHCAGGSDFGTAEEQVSAVKLALDNNGVHPDCPGCVVNRRPANSTTVCMTRHDEVCAYDCPSGFVPTGPHVCYENGTMIGGACIVPAVDTETHEMMTPSPIPSPSPSVFPSLVNYTKQDIGHENWTDYERQIEEEETAHYQVKLAESACLYLLDLENDFHSRGELPRKPIRSKLYVAAKAARCAWYHDEVVSTATERKHRVPVRGDHGPWPIVMTPNLVHVATSHGERIAVVVDLSQGKGVDMYRVVAQQLSIQPDMFTIYKGPGQPIELDAPLAPFEITKADTLQLVYGDDRGWVKPTIEKPKIGQQPSSFDLVDHPEPY